MTAASPQFTSRNTRAAQLAAQSSRHTWRMAAMGWTLVTEIIAGALIGWGLDWLFNTRPTFLIIATTGGVIVGLATFIRSALRESRKSAANAPHFERQNLVPDEEEEQHND